MVRWGVILLLLAVSSAALASGGDETTAYTMVLFLHQILFVFWLGPDIGVYMWSTKVTNPELTPAQRVSAGRIMRVIDIIPKACMALMLTIGGLLTEMLGLPHPWWQMAGIILLGPLWLTLTLLTFRQYGTEGGMKMAEYDIWLRWLVVITVTASVIFSVLTGRLEDTPWLTGKLLLFATVVLFSIFMRLRFAGFMAGLDRMEAEGPSPEVDQQLAGAISRTRPFMFSTWLALAIAAGLGVVQPGSPETVPTLLEDIAIPAD